MRLGIMQPYFFPYLGYFALISNVDKWIVFDVTQYTPRTWMNRNRILHPKHGWQYVTVPIKNSSTLIKTFDAKVLSLSESKKTIIGKVSHYKKKAPYFNNVINVIHQAFDYAVDDSLVNLNVCALQAVCDYLNLSFPYQICSNLELDYPSDVKRGDWALFICQEFGATEYINPVSGKNIFDVLEFKNREVKLYFSEYKEFKYSTISYEYEPHLSILDVMMWNSPEEILYKLKQGRNEVVRAF